MKLELHEIDWNNADEVKRWNDFVDQTAEGTIFHKSCWLSSISGGGLLWADRVKLMAVEDQNGQWLAGLPIPYKVLAGKSFIVMPYFTPYLGTIFSLGQGLKNYKAISLKKEINMLAADSLKKAGMVILYSFVPDVADMQPFIWKGLQVTVHYTYMLGLHDLDRVRANLEQKRRNDINQGIKKEFETVWGYEKNMSLFLELNRATFKRQKVEKYDQDAMERLLYSAYKAGACNVGVVYDKNGQPMASCALVWDNKRAYYIGGGINASDHAAMSFIMWDAIRYTKEALGLEQFDFEGSMVPGIENYFRKFGGDIVPYFNIMSKTALAAKWAKDFINRI